MSAHPEEEVEMLEAGFSSDELLPAPRSSRVLTPKRMIAMAVGVLGLAGCGYVMTRGGGAAPADAPQVAADDHVTARALLEHPEFLDAVSNNILTLGRGLLDDKADKLRPTAAVVFKRVSELMQERDPEGTRYLDSVKLSPKQRGSVVSAVKAMSNKKVQDVGHEVLEIAYKHKDEGAEGVKTAVEKVQRAFGDRAQELQDLKQTVVPVELQQKSEAPVADIKERRLATTTACTGDTSQCHPGSELTSAMGKGMNMKVEDALGIVGGVLEQARLALDASAVIGTSFGSQTHVPWFVRSLVGGVDFGVETMDCFMRQDDQHKMINGKEVLVNANSGHTNSVKMMMCPMKYAGAAMDMLSGANDAVGIQNNKLPADFQMMFGGQPQTGYNPYQQNRGYPQQQQQQFNPLMSMFQPQQQQQRMQQQQQHPMVQQMQHMSNMANMYHMMTGGQQQQQQQRNPFAYNR